MRKAPSLCLHLPRSFGPGGQGPLGSKRTKCKAAPPPSPPPGPFWPQNSALLFQPTSVSHLGAMRVFCVPCCAVWDFSPGWGWGQYGLCHVWVCHLPHSLAAASSPALGAGTEAQCSGASTLTWGLLGFSPFPWAWFKMGGGRGLRAFSLAWVGRG